jgi:DNA topoisomerase-3
MGEPDTATSPREEDASALGACPRCGAVVVEQTKSFGCSAWKQGCKFAIWKMIAGRQITGQTARELLQNGKTDLLQGFVSSKSGKKFDARLKLEEGEVRFEFEG